MTPSLPVQHALPHTQLLDALELESVQRGLDAYLARAATRHRPPGQAVQALLRLDPDGAAEWVLGCGRALSGLLDDDGRARVLERVAEDARAAPAPERVRRALAAALLHPDVVTGDTVVALSEAMPREEWTGELEGLARAALAREPGNPRLLLAAARMAAAGGDASRAHALLDRAGRADHGAVQVQAVARARSGLRDVLPLHARVALLGSYTLDLLVPHLDLECRIGGVAARFHLGPYAAWERELRSPGRGLAEFRPDVVLVAAALDDLVPALSGGAEVPELAAAGDEAVERVCAAVQAFRAGSTAPVVVFSFHSAFPDPLGPAAGTASRSAWIAGLNQRLAARLRDLPDAWMLDLGEALLRRAEGAVDEPGLRHLARMRIPPGALPGVARACAGFVVPLAGGTRKCIVVDLDNTLWGGVVGEDGVGGIRLGSQAPGSEYVELQEWLRAKRRQGFLLAVVSKNNEADALEAIRGHDAMVLREGDFAAMRVNWERKHDNLRSIAVELGIGLDAMVFVDDNREERELVRATLPAVLVPELPDDPSRWRGVLETLPQLRTLRVTAADRARTDQYRQRAERTRARQASGSLGDFLGSLEMAVRVEPAGPATLGRVHQLFQRTNQFNATTRRYELARLSDAMAGGAWRLLALWARDRLTDHGLVGAALVETAPGGWRVDNLVLSCRVIGYGVENAFVAAIAGMASDAGAPVLRGESVATARNVPARELWAQAGFVPAGREGEVETWERTLAGTLPEAPSWITLEAPHAS